MNVWLFSLQKKKKNGTKWSLSSCSSEQVKNFFLLSNPYSKNARQFSVNKVFRNWAIENDWNKKEKCIFCYENVNIFSVLCSWKCHKFVFKKYVKRKNLVFAIKYGFFVWMKETSVIVYPEQFFVFIVLVDVRKFGVCLYVHYSFVFHCNVTPIKSIFHYFTF